MKNVTKKRLEMVRKEFKYMNDLILILEEIIPHLYRMRNELNDESKRLMKLIVKKGR